MPIQRSQAKNDIYLGTNSASANRFDSLSMTYAKNARQLPPKAAKVLERVWLPDAHLELMEMSCRRLGEAWSLPAIAAPALAFSARWHGAEKLSKSGHRFRQQVVRFSLGGMRLFAQPLIGSPVHAARLLRKRLQRVVAPAEPHLDHLRSAPCAS